MTEDGRENRSGPAYRWRPAVAPYRPVRPGRIRPGRPSPGQMLLPGMEPEGESPPLPPAPDVDAECGLVCPNCGGTSFDDDGDCTACWEPGVRP